MGVEWANVAIAAAMLLIVLLGGAVAYGVFRQKVAGMQVEITTLRDDTEKALARQDTKIDQVVLAVNKATDVGHAVELLSSETKGALELLRQTAAANERLAAERSEGLRGEVRAFMAGAGKRRPQTPGRG